MIGPILALLLLTAPATARDLIVPDPDITPGVSRNLSRDEICTTKWGTDRRFVTAAMKREVFTRYGLTGNTDKACKRDKHGRRCEIDHCVPRSLGGADDVDNLWPQPYGGRPWNATRKDRLEIFLSKEYCAGRISLEDAIAEVCGDYRSAYIKYFGKPK